MLSATPISVVPKSPRTLHAIHPAQNLLSQLWKHSHGRHDLLENTSVGEIARDRKLLFVEETETTVEKLLNEFASHKTSFAVVMSNGRPIGTVDVDDLFIYCNDKISQRVPFEELVERLEVLKHQLAKSLLNEIIVYSENLKQNWYYRTISASRSVLHLLHILCRHPTLRKVPVLNEKGEVTKVIDRNDVLRFILDNEKAFADLLSRRIGDLSFQRQSLEGMKASRDQMMVVAFHEMWQKQINGRLGSCNRSSTLDLFSNYVHYVLSGFQVFPVECGPVGQCLVTSSVEDVMDLMLRENLDSVYVIDKQPKRVIGVLTIIELLASFC